MHTKTNGHVLFLSFLFFCRAAVPSHDNGFDPQLPYSVVAIADGVSSWRYEYGIDAGAFSNALVRR